LVHAGQPAIVGRSGSLDEGKGEADEDGDGHQLPEQDGLVGLKPAVVAASVVLVGDADHNLD